MFVKIYCYMSNLYALLFVYYEMLLYTVLCIKNGEYNSQVEISSSFQWSVKTKSWYLVL